MSALIVSLIDAKGGESSRRVNVPVSSVARIDEIALRRKIHENKGKVPYYGTPVRTPGALELVYTNALGTDTFRLRTDLKNTEVIPVDREVLDVFDIWGEQFRDQFTADAAHDKFQQEFRRFKNYDDLMKAIKKGSIFRLPRGGKFSKKRGSGVHT